LSIFGCWLCLKNNGFAELLGAAALPLALLPLPQLVRL